MGTNFYLRQPECSGCGRYDEYHIGKRSAGWSFGFRGYRDVEDDHPLGVVTSRAQWVQAVGRLGWTVFDEYRRQVPDPVAFLCDLEAPSLDQQQWERGHMGSYYWPTDRDWRDPEGFRFYDGEFS
jgi:hypothetical protein